MPFQGLLLCFLTDDLRAKRSHKVREVRSVGQSKGPWVSQSFKQGSQDGLREQMRLKERLERGE